jgi:hypothetical protein
VWRRARPCESHTHEPNEPNEPNEPYQPDQSCDPDESNAPHAYESCGPDESYESVAALKQSLS